MLKNRRAKFSGFSINIRMRFDRSVRSKERTQIIKALENICARGDENHRRCARFVLESPVLVAVDEAGDASGGAGIYDAEGANAAMARGEVSLGDAACFVQLIIARRTIQNGAVDLEGTLVHETQHVENDARTIHTLSLDLPHAIFNPTQYENELSAHITAANYLKMRGGKYARMGANLGLVKKTPDGAFEIDRDGILHRLENCYVVKNTDTPLNANSQGVKTTHATTPFLESKLEQIS